MFAAVSAVGGAVVCARPARHIIAFHAGDNDIALHQTAADTYAAFTGYVAAAHRQGWKVVVSIELRRYGFPPDLQAALLHYSDCLRANAAGAVAVVDLDQEPRFVLIEDRSIPGLFTHDGVHPSDGGYAVLGPVVRWVGSTG